MSMKNILVVDDEMGIRELLSEILFEEGYGVLLAENAQEARLALQQHHPDVVLLDVWMPDIDGLTLLKEWGSQGMLTMPVIMMSGHSTIETAVEATRIGAADFLEKPVALKKLLATIAQVTKEWVAPPPLASGKEGAEVSQQEYETIETILNMPLREARDRFDTIYLKHHLKILEGNIAAVADQIGIERTHLYRKLKQLGIKLPRKAGDL